ncbi:hypothetical protein Unana1_00468 [Umbelopsis nana]
MQQYNDPHHLATASYHLTRHQSYDDQGTLDLTASDPLQYNSMFKFQNAAQPSLSGQPLQLGQQSFGQNPISNNDPDGQQRMSAQSSFTYPQHGFRPVSIPMNQQAMASSPFMSPQRQQLHLPTKMDHGNGNVNDQYSSFHTMNSAEDMVASLTQASQNVTSMYDNVDIRSLVNSPALSVADLPTTTLPPLSTNILDSPPSSSLTPSPSNETEMKERGFGDRTQWTPEEDQLLRLAVQVYGPNTEKWSKIAECVPGRTNKNCRKRWFHSLDPSLRKGPWTEEEDQLLREGVARFPKKQWSKIADIIHGRTDDQCAKRWRESLDPNIDRSSWTEEEDKLLLQKFDEYGTQWQKIALYFPGRPGLHCRNRWRKLKRSSQHKAGSFVPELRREDSTTGKSSPLTDSDRTSPPRSLDSGSASPITQSNSKLSKQGAMPPLSSSSDPSILAQFQDSSASMVANSLGMQQQEQEQLSQQSSLDEARREMLEEMNPYGCDVPGCYASFSASSGLFYHMKGVHTNLEGISKPYRCAIPGCTKRYKNINGLQYHIRDAKGSSGHAPAIVREDGTLESPMTDNRPYKCQVPRCKKAYRTPNGLHYHEQHGHGQGQTGFAPGSIAGSDTVGSPNTGKRRRNSVGQSNNTFHGQPAPPPPQQQQQQQQQPGSNLHLLMGSPQQRLAQFAGQAMSGMPGVNMNAMRATSTPMMPMQAPSQSPQMLQRMQLPSSATSSPAQQHATLNNPNSLLLAGMMSVTDQGRYGDARLFKCPQMSCGQAFQSLSGLQLHQRQQHGQTYQQHYQQLPYAQYQTSPHQSPHHSPQLQQQNMMFSPHLGFSSVPFQGGQSGDNLQNSPHMHHTR